MKTSSKWILGIVIGLVVLAALGAVGYLAARQWIGGRGPAEAYARPYWDGDRAMPWRGMPWQGMPGQIMPHHSGQILPGFRPGAFMLLFPAGLGLLCLGLLALIGLGAVALVRSLKGTSTAAAPVQAIQPAEAPAMTCPNCGRPVQDDWGHCPYCGTALLQQTGERAAP